MISCISPAFSPTPPHPRASSPQPPFCPASHSSPYGELPGPSCPSVLIPGRLSMEPQCDIQRACKQRKRNAAPHAADWAFCSHAPHHPCWAAPGEKVSWVVTWAPWLTSGQQIHAPLQAPACVNYGASKAWLRSVNVTREGMDNSDLGTLLSSHPVTGAGCPPPPDAW